MRQDLWRLAAFSTAGLLIGILLDELLAGLVIGLVAYLGMQIWQIQRLRDWISSRSESGPALLPGMLDNLAHEIASMRAWHRQREERLSQFLQRFQEASAALQDAIVILNQDNEVEWANARAFDYLGVRWPHDANQRLANLVRYPGLQDYLELRDPAQYSKEISLPSPQNEKLMLEYRLMPYGDRLRLLIARDITQLQQINQMRRDFIANASHELRTPLTVIAGYLEEMESDEVLINAGFVPIISQMRKQTARMQALIEDLLTLSALETESQKNKELVVAVPDMLANIHKEAVTVSGERNHVFSLELQPGLHMRGNSGELYSAFSNLIMNAVRYTPARGLITIRWYADEYGAHMEVTDTGEGIRSEHIPRLTERFYRADKGRSRESGGTGLGLAIVKHVLTRHGAQLHIDSTLGRGSTFRCDFSPERVVLREATTNSPVN